MKKAKYFLIAVSILLATTVTSTATAQLQQVKTKAGKLVTYGEIGTLTTVDSTLTVIDTLLVSNLKAGLIEVTVSAQDSLGNGVTGKQIYRYKKIAGTITLATAADISATVTDAALGTATYTFTATASNNLQLKVKGKLGRSVYWRTLIKPF